MASRGRIGALVDECRGRVLAALVANLGNLDLAEDALQDALLRALERWPGAGLPDNPAGWLYRAARNRAIDELRRDRGHAEKLPALALHMDVLQGEGDDAGDEVGDIPDERLRLMFTCCHPALAPEARVALTLKTLGRLSTPEIARAFLIPEATMAQRLVRAKRKIASAGIPWRVPEGDDLPARLESVLAVVYLVFNEGYSAASGEVAVRGDLCDEAIRLARIVATLAPDEPEAASLLALLLLHDSRRHARQDAERNLVPLEQQDRRRWDAARIAEGEDALIAACAATSNPGPYQLQALIAAEHARAPTFEQTDWLRVAEAYDRLYRIRPDRVVRINGAVALSFAHSPATGLTALEPLAADPGSQRYLPYHAARADILRRMGHREDAAEAYRQALALEGNGEQKRFLQSRLAMVESVA